MTEATTTSTFYQALVTIDWPFNATPPIIRCPITGMVVGAGYDPASGANADEFTEPDHEKVPTMMFSYIPEVGEFDFIRPELLEVIEAKRAELVTADSENEELAEFEILTDHVDDLGKCPMIFEVATSGTACGPVSSSVYIGLDWFRPFDQPG